MLATPLSKLNISCTCTECSTFLRPLPNSLPPVDLLPTLLPSTLNLDFSFPPTPAPTPLPTRKTTPSITPRLIPTAPTLAPPPAFLLTRSHSNKSRTDNKGPGAPLALPSLSLSPPPTSDRVTFASRSLWARISSPIDELATPLTAKTPGLSACSQEMCNGKLVPGFGRTVCGSCEVELKGAVLGLGLVGVTGHEGVGDEKGESVRNTLSRVDSGIVLLTSVDKEVAAADKQTTRRKSIDAEPSLFAIPSTPPSRRLLITHSRARSAASPPQHSGEEGAPTLFALPNTSLDSSFEDFAPTMPTTRYARDFPTLPPSSGSSQATKVKALKRSSEDVEGLAWSLSKNGRREGKTGSQTGSKTALQWSSKASWYGPGGQ